MLRGMSVWVGLICVLGVMVASMTMNFLFGYGFGTTPATALVWGGLSVAVDGLKALLPLRIAAHVGDRRWTRTVLASAIFAPALAYGFMSAVGFAGQSRSLFTLGRENAADTLAEASEDLKKLQDERMRLGRVRLREDVQAQLNELHRDRRWAATDACAKAVNVSQRKLCRQADALEAELAGIARAAALDISIDRLKSKRQQAREQGGAQAADYQVAALQWIVPVDTNAAAKGLSWLAAVLVELVSAFGLLVMEQRRAEGASTAAPEPAWELVPQTGS
jgi:hypothetical protein